MSDLSHLTESAAGILALSDEERIYHIKKPRWIAYKRSQEILKKLEDLLTYPKQSRMPNMLLIGASHNGKTALIERFLNNHPPDPNHGGEAMRVPVLCVQSPPSADENGFYTAILEQLFQTYPRTESTFSRRARVVSVLSRVNLGVLLIDEVHFLLKGSKAKQSLCVNMLKYLTNELRVPIVGVGTAEAAYAMQKDEQLSNRFIPEDLPRWVKGVEFARLLVSFEKLLPLRYPSELATPALATKILDESGGLIGEVSKMLNAAAIYAIENRIERITKEVIDKCDYKSAPRRKEIAYDL